MEASAHFAVVARAADEPHLRLDRHREDEAVVVVGVLPDQVHPPGADDVKPVSRRAARHGESPLTEYRANWP